MHDDDLDLSPLDPTRDARRWEALLAQTTERALAARANRSLTGELARLSWPLTAAAACVAAAALLLATYAGGEAVPRALTTEAVAEWANAGEIPAGVDLLALTGEAP